MLASGVLVGLAGTGTLGVQQGLASAEPTILADEEAKLLELRDFWSVREREAQRELQARIEELEAEIQASDTKGSPFCATPYGVDVLGISEFIALLGALFGGLSARQRKGEVERLNNRLRDINSQLRRQARAGISYAPGLTYVPASVASGGTSVAENEQMPVAAPAVIEKPTPEEGTPEEIEMTRTMKEGKRLLKEGSGSAALVRFEKAAMLSRATGNKSMQRRAFRGLAAAERLQGQRQAAIRHLMVVLQISEDLDDFVGDADAYGTIADIYADMNDFDNAAKYYDLYLEEMRKVGYTPE